MAFTVPKGWEGLPQEQLHYIVRLLWLYGETPDWQQRAQTAALMHFCGIEVVNRTDKGWLCRIRKTGEAFLLDPDLLPSMCEQVEWICRTEEMTDRIEQVGRFKATDFTLRSLPFGEYLEAENHYQAFLIERTPEKLVPLARILYGVPEKVDAPELCEEYLLGTFFWYTAAKQVLGKWFPNFLKKTDVGGQEGTQRSQHESTLAQIRLLTKGDVTKQEYILQKTDTWTALAELDALAREAEEIKRKYGKP